MQESKSYYNLRNRNPSLLSRKVFTMELSPALRRAFDSATLQEIINLDDFLVLELEKINPVLTRSGDQLHGPIISHCVNVRPLFISQELSGLLQSNA